ncbi:hypothetical protein ACFQMB_06115 [Pseudobowmanella zhangzhouensis]
MDIYLTLASYLISINKDVIVVMCGWGSEQYIQQLSHQFESKGATFRYLGQLSQSDSVGYLKVADISIAHYSPDKIINVFAASNKIPEIIGSNTILLTNAQTKMANEILPYDISIQYEASISETFEPLQRLIDDRQALIEFIARANDYYQSNYNPRITTNRMRELFDEYL